MLEVWNSFAVLACYLLQSDFIFCYSLPADGVLRQ